MASDDLRAELDRGPVTALRTLAAAVRQGDIDLEAASRSLQGIAADVRQLSHGLYPPSLEHAGLGAALPEAKVPAGRFVPAVELTAYLLARGRTGAELTLADGALHVPCSADAVTAHADRVALLGGVVRDGTVRLPVEEA